MIFRCINRSIKSLVEDAARYKTTEFANELRECTQSRNLRRGKLVHRQIVESNLDSDRYLCNLLMEMYGKCGRLQEAETVFRKAPDRNVFSWNILLATYAQSGDYSTCIERFREMDLEGIKPNEVTFVSVVSSTADTRCLGQAELVHARVVASGFDKHVAVGSALINMFGKCGCPERASRVLKSLPSKNVVTWTSLIRAYVINGLNREALQVYDSMEVTPNHYTLACVAEACGKGGTLQQGKDIEARVVDFGWETLPVVAVALVDMYCKLGSLEDARRVFEEQQKRKNVFSRNVLARAYTQRGYITQTLDLYRSMEEDGVEPDCVTFLETLAACSVAEDLSLGVSVHVNAGKRGYDADELVCNALVTMYGKCGSLDVARSLFERIPRKNVVSWTTMAAAYAENGESKQALQLFHKMDAAGVKPNEQTFVSLLTACSGSPLYLHVGREIHQRVVASGYKADGVVGNALVDMYGKCRSPEEAKRVFDSMSSRSIVAWTSMISAYAQSGLKEEAFKLYRELPMEPTSMTYVSILEACSGDSDLENGEQIHEAVTGSGYESDVYVGTALVDMYGKCGDVEAARGAFDKISRRNVVSWNAMISVYIQNGLAGEALELYYNMDVEADRITFICVLDACAALGDVVQGKSVHRRLEKLPALSQDPCVGNALLRMYASCGDLHEARRTFTSMRFKNLTSWNEMTVALASTGNVVESLSVFHEMEQEGVDADETSLTGILSACSHAGMKQEGWRIFVSMERDFGILQASVHYVCLVDMLGRVGQVEEAEEVIKCMPYEPGFMAWMTLLGSCAVQGDAVHGAAAARRLFLLNQRKTSAYVLLSNLLK